MVHAEEGNSWIYKNKDHGKSVLFYIVSNKILCRYFTGMMSAAASLGLSLLWDPDVGLSHVDKYTYSAEEYIKVSLVSRSNMNLLNRFPGWCAPRNRYFKHVCAD